jgi:seryl-tRNA synthetase
MKEEIREMFLTDFVNKTSQKDMIQHLIKLDDKHKELQQERDELKKRINKAIDYTKLGAGRELLLKILKGSDE